MMAAALVSAASPLGGYVDHARVLVVSAPGPRDSALRSQDAVLGGASAGLKVRDVMVVRAVGPAQRHSRSQGDAAARVRTAAALPPGRFGVALVGKDGGVKFGRSTPVSVQTLFAAIDTMPMRLAEMRRLGAPR